MAKGVYYRAGTFRGHPVETNQIIYMDSGVMGVTNKHIYFTGPSKSFRVKFEKIVSLKGLKYFFGKGFFNDKERNFGIG